MNYIDIRCSPPTPTSREANKKVDEAPSIYTMAAVQTNEFSPERAESKKALLAKVEFHSKLHLVNRVIGC